VGAARSDLGPLYMDHGSYGLEKSKLKICSMQDVSCGDDRGLSGD
jgi:hypothetical protein